VSYELPEAGATTKPAAGQDEGVDVREHRLCDYQTREILAYQHYLYIQCSLHISLSCGSRNLNSWHT